MYHIYKKKIKNLLFSYKYFHKNTNLLNTPKSVKPKNQNFFIFIYLLLLFIIFCFFFRNL